MGRSILINGLSRPVRLTEFELVEAGRNGEVGMGGFNVDSENAAFDFNSHWPFTVVDTAAGSNIFTGYIADKDINRGPFAVVNDRQFDTNIVDLNTKLIDDIMTGSSANRPAETDIARVTWLVGTSFLDGMGATIGSSGATNLEAQDFRTQNPLQLLTNAAEASGKLFFVYYDLATGAPKLFYDLATASNFITPHKISTLLADGSNPQCHFPRKDSLSRKLDGGRIYSEVLFKYDGGSVTVTNTATASNYRSRKTVVYDNSVKTSGMATTKATQYLANAAREEEIITLEVDVEAADALAFRAGQLMQIKAPHLGLPTFVDRRIVRTSKKPRTDTDEEGYRIAMELSIPTANHWGSRGVPTDVLPDSVTGGATPPATEPAPTETTGCATPGASGYARHGDLDGDGTVTTDDLGNGPVCSKVAQNVAWGIAGCPIGGGGWQGWQNEELWTEYSVPADDPDYLGLVVTVDASALTWGGPFRGPFLIRIASGGLTSTSYGSGTTVGGISDGQVLQVYIPRSAVAWGGTNSIVIAPGWQCVQGAFYCNGLADFSNPLDDARGDSGQAGDWGLSDLCPVQFVAGGSGSSGWVAGLGDVDGVNRTFTLIDWSAAGTVEASVNGLIQPNNEVTLDTGAGTATLATAPPAGAIVLFLYTVAA